MSQKGGPAGVRSSAPGRDWTAAFEGIADPVFVHDQQYRIAYANPAYLRVLGGLPLEDVLRRPYWQLFPRLEGPMPGCAGAMEHGHGAPGRDEFVDDAGNVYLSRSYPAGSENGVAYAVHILFDITRERRAADQVESLARFPSENPYPVLRVAADGELLHANPASARLLDELAMVVGDKVPTEWRPRIERALQLGRSGRFDVAHHDGIYLFTISPIAEVGYANLYGTDITALRRSEARLRHRVQLESLLADASRRFLEPADDAIDHGIELLLSAMGANAGVDRSYLFRFGPDGRMSNTHEWCGAGIDPQQARLQSVPVEAYGWIVDALRRDGQLHVPDIAGLPHDVERIALERQGVKSLVAVSVQADGALAGFIGFETVRKRVHWNDEDLQLLHLASDLVGSALTRQRMETSLFRANRALRTLSSCNEILVRAEDEAALLRNTCKQVVEAGGYLMSWVGFQQYDEARRVLPVARAGYDADYLDNIVVTWGDEPSGRGPVGMAIRSGRPAVTRFAESDPGFSPWRQPALERGYRSVAALPLNAGGQSYGALAIYASEPDAFDEAELALLQELADDLAFGIASLRERRAREQATAELARSERHLRHLNRTYAVLSECNQALVRAESEQALLDAFCERLTTVGAYALAWVGYREYDPVRHVKPVAWSGRAEEYLTQVEVGWGDDELGSGPTGTAIRTGEPIICRDNEADPGYRPWRPAARHAGLRSAIALPLRIEGTVIGTLQIYAQDQDVFDDDEQRLLSELADDLAFGIATQRTRLAREEAESALQLRNRAIESAQNGVIISEALPGDRITYVNPAFSQITGYSREEALGRSPAFLSGEEIDQPGLREVRQAQRRGREASVLLRNYRKDGSLFWNELRVSPVRAADGTVTHYVGIINDVSERKHYEEQLEFQANFDALTGLPNRNLMQDRLAQALIRAQRTGSKVAVLFLDIDHFKRINDTLGHGSGDELLQQAADRLRRVLHSSDSVARYGGDEFVVVLTDIEQPEDVSRVASRLQAAVAEPVRVTGQELQVSLSIGVSLYPRDGADPAALLKNADSAMYRAKELGRNNFQYYTAELNGRLLERMNLENDLRRGLQNGELSLHYQPQVDLRTGRVSGVEALLRWQHPRLGLVSPATFIGLAEESGLIVSIGKWVLRTAARQAVRWRAAGLPPITMAVNVSARQLLNRDLVETVAEVLEETGLEPRLLEIELTESAVMERPDEMAQMLEELKGLGVDLALDDFGTGYSSLSHLHRFRFDKVKIDQGFVQDITVNPQNAAIVLAVISLARGLGLTVIAEGVESEAQLRYLRHHGCDQMQGYLFSRPLAPEDADATLQRHLDMQEPDREELPTLLLVDGDPKAIRAMTGVLHDGGFRILGATTPGQALELLALHRVQVMLCDQRLPSMTGIELLSRVRRLYPHTVRIVLSGHADLDTVADAVNRGNVYKFLTKPWQESELKQVVWEAFEECAQHRSYDAEPLAPTAG